MITVHLETIVVSALLMFGVSLLLFHVYIRHRRLDELSLLKERISQLESLNAALGLRFITLAEIIGRRVSSDDLRSELNDLVRSTLEAFKTYRTVFPTGIQIDAGGDVNVGGDVTGRDKEKG